MNLDELLRQVAAGTLAPADAAGRIAGSTEASLGFARIDLDRPRRCGVPEVVFCPGKTAEQIVAILRRMADAGHNVLASRISADQVRIVREALPAMVHHEAARCLTLDVAPLPEAKGQVAVITAGTSDIPVAEEAALTASRMGARVERIFDVGVAGLHRLMKHLDTLRASRAIVVVAGMEGALPSVVGGLVDRPIVAVPTSVGYGVNLGGLTTLMAMLNSCVPGITVVNIDNGFGAGVAAAMINRGGEVS
ncbi:MAG: nickel pincer cofactor biosynthesis protein LarB [Verrucomicrobia bacterium]|nr:nickel pincer cofactor biosynthesis protein LarB [Verrucomicrobiota bacterium]